MSTTRLLVVATKLPWPPVGGGNAILHNLLEGLAERGADVTALAPTTGNPDGAGRPRYRLLPVPAAPNGWLRATAGLLTGSSALLQRYRLRLLVQTLDRALTDLRPDVVHVEQVQLAWLLPHLAGRVPVLLRQQNVESELVKRYAGIRRPPASWLLRLEARRLAAIEAAACTTAHAVAAVSEQDATALRSLAPAARVTVLPPAWQAPERVADATLEGDPPVVCLGSFDWRPNRDGALWFLREAWPAVAAALPGAVLHLAGPGSRSLRPAGAQIRRHGVVASPSALADPRAVVVAPVRVASGIRVRVLEAWSLGLPAVTTSRGGSGLVETDGDGALLADSAAGIAEAVIRLASDPALRRRLVERGHQRLAEFAIPRVAARALEIYDGLVTSPRPARSS